MRRSFILICVALLLSAFANAQSYDITVNITGNGNVVYNDAAVQNAEVITVDENATPAFTITAATGSHVASVILDIANEGGTNVTSQLVDNVYIFAAVTANHTLDVTFEADPVPTYTITLNVTGNGTVTPNGENNVVTVDENETPAFTITPAAGSHVASVILDIANEGGTNVTSQLVDNVYTFAAVTANHTLDVTFEADPVSTYTITLNVTGNGTVTPNGENNVVTVDENETPAFTITPAAGSHVASVILDIANEGGTNVTSQLVDNVYTFAAVTANHTLDVTFEADPVSTYTITLNVTGNGTVTPNGENNVVTVDENETPAFTITPAAGSHVASVILDIANEGGTNVTSQLVDNVYTFAAVTANHTLDVTFEADETPTTYTITFTIGEHGAVTYNGEAVTTSVTVNENAEPAFTITPESGYRVASAIIDEDEVGEEDVTDAIEDNVYTFEAVTANHTMHITFEENTTPNTHTVTLTVGEHGTIVATDGDDNPVTIEAGVITVNHGDDLSLEITPENGYKIDELVVNENPYVLEDDELLGLDLPLLNITSDMTVSVTFEEDNDTPEPTMFGITFVGLEEGNTVTVPENARVDSVRSGDDYVFGITLTSCQQAIASVTVGGTELTATEGQYTIENVVSDTTVTVEFTKYFYTVTAEAGEHGAVAEGFASHDVECGTDYTITFVPEEGYILDSVVVDNAHVTAGVNGNNFTLTNVTAVHAVKGFFAVDTNIGSMFAVTFEGLGNNDTIVVPVNADSSYLHTSAVVDSVLYGEDFVFAINPEKCHYVETVSVNGTTLDANGEGLYTINVTRDTTVSVEFITYRYTVTASAGEHGRLASDAETEVECGSSLTLSFVPEAGYKLGSVLVDGEATTEGIDGNNYTLVVDADHTIVGEFSEFRGPYVEYVGLSDSYEVGDTIDFSLKMHANCMYENLCGVGYEMVYIDSTGTSTVVADATRYGVFSYNVNVTDEDFVTSIIENGRGMLNYVLEDGNTTYNVEAFTLGLFDEVAGRNRTVDYNMMFTTAGRYQFKTTLYSCSNGGDALTTNFRAPECDDMTHIDRVAETCSNPSAFNEYMAEITITGATIHTITTVVLGGHGTVDPEGTIIVEAGTEQRVVFTPDENYALDTVMVNGIMKYPTVSTVQYVIDSVYTIESINENQYITVKFKDVRPYYDVHVEVMTAGGNVTPKDTSVVVGSDVTLRVTPNSGYHISQLEIDGNLISNYASNEITFRDIHEDHNVSISFFPNSVEDEVFAGLSIYPNPNNGQFTVSSEDFEGDVTFQIYGVSGSMLYEKTTNGEQTVSFDNNLSAGTYFLRIISGDKVAARKIVVE